MAWLKGTLTLTGSPPPQPIVAQNVGGEALVRAQNVGGGAAAAHVVGHAAAADAGAAGGGQADINLENILKLVPAEVVAPYIIGCNKILENHNTAALLPWFAVCLLASIAVRAQASRPKQRTNMPWYREVSWPIVAVSAVAFVIWAHAVIAQPPLLSWFDQFWAGLAALLFGAVAPKFVPASAIQG